MIDTGLNVFSYFVDVKDYCGQRCASQLSVDSTNSVGVDPKYKKGMVINRALKLVINRALKLSINCNKWVLNRNKSRIELK